MLLLKLLQFRSRIDWSLSNLVALLRWNLFTHKDLWKWIDDPFIPPPDPPPGGLVQGILDGITPACLGSVPALKHLILLIRLNLWEMNIPSQNQ